LLQNQKVSVNLRLRLFDKTVGSCVCWCCESWTPRASELQSLESARRSMLRKIVGTRRGTDEEWLDWIRRATRKAIECATRAGVRDWATLHSERKWQWAGHVARQGAQTWTYRVTTWRDSAWQELCDELGVARERRPSKRRWMKWEASVRDFCRDSGRPPWTELSQDREAWKTLALDFARQETLGRALVLSESAAMECRRCARTS
jgi:hypothetical protein